MSERYAGLNVAVAYFDVAREFKAMARQWQWSQPLIDKVIRWGAEYHGIPQKRDRHQCRSPPRQRRQSTTTRSGKKKLATNARHLTRAIAATAPRRIS